MCRRPGPILHCCSISPDISRKRTSATASPASWHGFATITANRGMDVSSDWLADVKIAVIGLGYVGLPLAVELGKKFPVVGFDIKEARVQALKQSRDDTRETTPEELAEAAKLSFTC